MVLRRYTPPTCTLEIQAKDSPLSRWARRPVFKQLRFELRFDDPRQPEEQRISIFGDRADLEALHEAVTTYVQDFLEQSPAQMPLGSAATLVGSIRSHSDADGNGAREASLGQEDTAIAAKQPYNEAMEQAEELPQEEKIISIPDRDNVRDMSAYRNGEENSHWERSPHTASSNGNLELAGRHASKPQLLIPYLQPRGLLGHDLFLGRLATPESGPVIPLSVLQLFDLATALDEYAAELLALPALGTAGRQPFPAWTNVAAMLVLGVGITTGAIALLNKPKPSTQTVVLVPSPTTSPTVVAQATPTETPPPLILGLPTPPLPTGAPLPTTSVPTPLPFPPKLQPPTPVAAPNIASPPPSLNIPGGGSAQQSAPSGSESLKIPGTAPGSSGSSSQQVLIPNNDNRSARSNSQPTFKTNNDNVPPRSSSQRVLIPQSELPRRPSSSQSPPLRRITAPQESNLPRIVAPPEQQLPPMEPPNQEEGAAALAPLPNLGADTSAPDEAASAPAPAPAPLIPPLPPAPRITARKQPKITAIKPLPEVSSTPAVAPVPDRSGETLSNDQANISGATRGTVSAQGDRSASSSGDNKVATGSLLDSIPQVAEARSFFQQRWQPPKDLTQTLEYSLQLNPDGSIQRIKPLGKASGNYIDRTGMPLLGEPFVSAVQSGGSPTIRVVLTPDGKVQTFLQPQ